MKGEKTLRDRAYTRGIVYAAGWLCSAHNVEDLAEELLASADLLSAAQCLAAGADPYDIQCARPALDQLKARRALDV